MSSEKIFMAVLATLTIIAAGCAGSDQRNAASGQPAPNQGFVPDTKPAPETRWVDAVVPAGTEMQVTVLDRLNSRSSRAGDRFLAQVAEAVVTGDTIAVPAGSSLKGVVAEGKDGSLNLTFEEITTPTGATAGVRARVSGGAGSAGGRLEGVINAHTRMTLVLEEPLRIKVKQ